MRPELSVVIVARNEAARMPALLADLAPAAAWIREVVVADGAPVVNLQMALMVVRAEEVARLATKQAVVV